MPALETVRTIFIICMIWFVLISIGLIIFDIAKRCCKQKIIAPHDEAEHGSFDYRRFE